MDYNFKEICAALKKVNIKLGDNVLCHSNLGFFGKPSKIKNSNELCKIFFEAFKNSLGSEGTLIVPTFTYSFFNKKKFDIRIPSKMGIFSEYVRNLNDSLRSKDPNFSISANGPLSEFFTDIKTKNTYGKNSFFDKFHKINGKILDFNFLGSTIIHYYERNLNVPYRYDKKFFGYVNKEKSTWIVYSRYLKKEFIHDPVKITNILRKKNYFLRSKLGKGEMTCVTSNKFYNTIKSEIKNNQYLLTEKSLNK